MNASAAANTDFSTDSKTNSNPINIAPAQETIGHSAEPRLPSYQEVVAQTQSHIGPIPSYQVGRRQRYHPYVRFLAPAVDETEKLLNTIYDDERVVLDVPPARPETQRRVFPLVARPPMDQEMRRQLERAIAFERRVHRLQPVLFEFFEGLQRAHRG